MLWVGAATRTRSWDRLALMSRPLKKFVIVHHVGYDESGDFDGLSEEVATILAVSARQAVDSYCLDAGVHRNSWETRGGRIWHEWYEAEEVDG